MELAKLVCGGKVEQYQRIKCASVEFVSFSDDEVDEKREETEIGEEHASLIVKGNNREIELQDMSEMRTVRTPKISTFARKSSPLHSKETIELCIHKMDNTSFSTVSLLYISVQDISFKVLPLVNTIFTQPAYASFYFVALEVSKKATVLGLKNALQKKFEMCGCQISW